MKIARQIVVFLPNIYDLLREVMFSNLINNKLLD